MKYSLSSRRFSIYKGMKKLYKSKENKVLTGTIGGVGEFFNVDPTILRIAWVIITIFSGLFPGIIIYILAALIVPNSPGQR